MSRELHPLGESVILSMKSHLTERIQCQVCFGELIQPKTCMNCKTSFCRQCVDVTLNLINTYI